MGKKKQTNKILRLKITLIFSILVYSSQMHEHNINSVIARATHEYFGAFDIKTTYFNVDGLLCLYQDCIHMVMEKDEISKDKNKSVKLPQPK